MEKQYFYISQELAQSVLNYLTEKPYREVAHLISEMSLIQPVPKNRDIKAITPNSNQQPINPEQIGKKPSSPKGPREKNRSESDIS